MGLLSFLPEAEKLILLNGLVVGCLAFQTELRELMHRFGLAMGLLSFLPEANKSICQNGLAVVWLGFPTKLRELMHRFGLARSC